MNKFFLYARKSTDEPDRQILSIESQIDELKEFAEREQLEIVETFVESQTAKEPGRPIFNNMLSLIEKGKASGILAWHPDRLARNSIDGGKIIYLCDLGKIKELKFPTFWFDATPQGKFMLNIAFGQSKYYVDNLSENVKRGLRQKVRRGEQSGQALTGYLNDKLNKKIIPDPERFRLVRKMFEVYATGNYSLKDTRNLLAQKGLVSKNGKVLTISNTQMILKNPFYYGMFKFNGELYQGKHEPAISKKLFDKCAEVSARNAHPMKRGIIQHVFRGIFLCGECGCGITSEVQKGHTYYRCTKKKGVCAQKYIREEFLAEQVNDTIKKVSLPSEWKEFMLAELDKEQASSFHSDELFVQNLKNQIKSVEETLDRLLDAHLDSTITSEEYVAKKQKLLNQKIDFSEKLKDFERKGNRWLELSKQFILDSNQAIIIASEENLEAKRDFLKKIGSNPRLASRSLFLDFKNPWRILAETPVASLCDAPNFGENGDSIFWLGYKDSNLDTQDQNLMSYH